MLGLHNLNLEGRIKDIFGDNLLTGYIGGSTAKGTECERSDIDLFLCVLNKDESQLEAFRRMYFDIHNLMQKIPDKAYPGEVMSINELSHKLSLVQKSVVKRNIENHDIYDGIVWSGMLSDPKIFLFHNNSYDYLFDMGKENILYLNKKIFGILNSSRTDILKKFVKFKNESSILKTADLFRDRIKSKKVKLTEIMLSYESHGTIIDEFERSDNALTNISLEERFILDGQVDYISSFLPVNLPLYSLIIFGLIPSLMSERIFIKPPNKAKVIVKKIFEEIFSDYYPLSLKISSRNDFIKKYVNYSDVVLFTGRYNNAESLIGKSNANLFIYNGAGINPIIVANGANIDYAVTKIIESRMFNSGQDCGGPDSILVDKSQLNSFLDILIKKISKIEVGDYNKKDNQVGKLIDPIKDVINGKIFKDNKKNIIFGGVIDEEYSIVHPTVIYTPINETKNYNEFFAPIVWVHSYNNEQELLSYFKTEIYQNFAMYVSVFGTIGISDKIPNSVILNNQNILDIERGNLPYGGYGLKANFIEYNGKRICRPILISKEISEWCKNNGK